MKEYTKKKIDIENVKYPVVNHALNKFSWEKSKGDKDALIVWYDGVVPKEEYYSLLPYQRINKIPGMNILCLKSNFFQTLNHMKILFESFFNFYPTTFILPIQYPEFQNEHMKLTGKKNRTVTWILKPKNGCGGNGIRLVQNIYDVAAVSQQAVVQRYIEPYLFGGYKFDFRLYVLVSNLAPYTVYIYKEGLARFCSRLYMKPDSININDKYSHLTNTSVNVENQNNSSSILQLSSTILNHIERLEPEKGKDVWKKIKHVVMLTFVAQYHEILKTIANHNTDRPVKYRFFKPEDTPGPPVDSLHKYFHLFGIDIMLNRHLEPIVLELNDRPSLCVTFDIEEELKSKLILDMVKLVTSSSDYYSYHYRNSYSNGSKTKPSTPTSPTEKHNVNSNLQSPNLDETPKQNTSNQLHVHLPPPSSTPHSPHSSRGSHSPHSPHSPHSARSSVRAPIQLSSTIKPSKSTITESPTLPQKLSSTSKSTPNIKLSSTSASTSSINLNSSTTSNINLDSVSASNSSNINLTTSSYLENGDIDKQQKLTKHNTSNNIKNDTSSERNISHNKNNIQNEKNNQDDSDDFNEDEPYFGGWELILPIDPSTPIGSSVKMMIDKSTKNVSKRFLPFPSYIIPPAPRKVSPKIKPQATLPPLYKSYV